MPEIVTSELGRWNPQCHTLSDCQISWVNLMPVRLANHNNTGSGTSCCDTVCLPACLCNVAVFAKVSVESIEAGDVKCSSRLVLSFLISQLTLTVRVLRAAAGETITVCTSFKLGQCHLRPWPSYKSILFSIFKCRPSVHFLCWCFTKAQCLKAKLWCKVQMWCEGVWTWVGDTGMLSGVVSIISWLLK